MKRIALVNQLQDESRWSFDFFALIALSTAIAALGLLQDSAAVVIGAMLVAPLMTPLLGAGLAVAQGNLPLVTTAVSLGHTRVSDRASPSGSSSAGRLPSPR